MSHPTVHLVQWNIAWEDPERNFAAVEQLLAENPPSPGSLLVLPEMFSTGFSMDVDGIAETEQGRAHAWVRDVAAKTRCTVVAGVVRRAASGRGQNIARVVGPDGEPVAEFAKAHPFRFAGEHEHYEGGRSVTLFDWQGFRVCPLVCYDLRFPELFRMGVDQGAELYLVIANWPTPRIDHWSLLLRARAIENQAYVAGVNRVGEDPFVRYPGRSAVIDFLGRTTLEMGSSPGIASARLDAEALRAYRAKFPALADRRIQMSWAEDQP